MPRYLLTIAYDGTNYAGFQRQPGEDTVQERLEGALAKMFGGRFPCEGSGRTDAGVHAFGMAAHVDVPRPFAPPQLRLALNGNLPKDIAVQSVRAVPESFHARFHACGKRYLYRFVVDPVRPAVGRGYFHWVRRSLDVAAMRAAAGLLRGRHDFASFASNPGYERKHGTVRTMRHLHLRQRGRVIDLWVQGDGFLYNMVRAFAGTLLDVGLGRYGPARVAEILAACDRRVAGATAPAHALYLVRVLYADHLFDGSPCETGTATLPSAPSTEVE